MIKGHVKNGVVVIDDGTRLPEGTHVSIVPEEVKVDRDAFLSLRGTVLRYDDPFGPAVPIDDWNALRDSD